MASSLPPKSSSSGSSRSSRSSRDMRSQRGTRSSRSTGRQQPQRQMQLKVQRQRQSSAALMESLSIADIDRGRRAEARAASRNRAAAATRRTLIVVGIAAVIIIISLLALFILSNTDTFVIEDVRVEGADHLTDAEVQALVPIKQGTTLLNVDSESVKNSLMRDSWIEDVEVNRIFPSTLQIVVHERQVEAIVEIPMGATQTIQSWAISKDGMWLMAIPNRESQIGSQLSKQIYDDANKAMHITGVDYGLVPEIGVYCTDQKVLNALSIVSGMTTQLADQVKTVNATDAESTLITLNNNIEIAFGTPENIREKERICLEIMEKNPTVVYINVRVVDRPTWRAA